MINMVLFMILVVMDIMADEPPEEGYECKEDGLVDNFLKLLMSEIILRYTFYLYWNIYLKLKSCFIKGFEWQTEFELSDEFVWFLAIEQILWSSMMVYPIIAWVTVIVMYLHCRYLVYRLMNQKKQPIAASNDMSTGTLMNMYLTFTFIVTCAFFSSILFIKMPRYAYFNWKLEITDDSRWCGPFKSNNILSPIDEVKLFPEEGSLVNRFVFCILVQFAVYVILYMIAYNSNVHINVLQKVKEVKFKEYD